MKVSELVGAQLDYWAAQAEGLDVRYCSDRSYVIVATYQWSPSTRWSEAGPIIEREKIGLDTWQREWAAQFTFPVTHPTNPKRDPSHHRMNGPTPLVAAMRTFVASRYGEEVPDE